MPKRLILCNLAPNKILSGSLLTTPKDAAQPEASKREPQRLKRNLHASTKIHKKIKQGLY